MDLLSERFRSQDTAMGNQLWPLDWTASNAIPVVSYIHF